MYVQRVKLKNWRNFKHVDVVLQPRQFLIGPNASGKSNFLDVFRFLRDISSGGGLQQAVQDRGGVTKLRSLAARRDPEITIEVTLADWDEQVLWVYSLSFKQEPRGHRRVLVTGERVLRDGVELLARPESVDEEDDERLTQTHLEQISANHDFRAIANHFAGTTYLHLVPQLLRYPQLVDQQAGNDPFGHSFLDHVARSPAKTRKSRLQRIERALKLAVPALEKLEFVQDKDTGRPHLQALYTHWRPGAGRQREDQFSDGTLRLIGLLWALMEGNSLLLLEEPELSLNDGIVSRLAPLLAEGIGKKRRQVIITTHSPALLRDPGIGGDEVLVLQPQKEGTHCSHVSDDDEMRGLLHAGLSIADVALSAVEPSHISDLRTL